MKSLSAKQTELRAKMASYERAIMETPQVEREYLDLTRDQEGSVMRYREIKAKQMQAEIGQELEKDRKGERFSLIDPPQLPEQPSSPNRPAILLLGFVFSLAGGLGTGAALEGVDRSVRGSKVLSGLVRAPLLAVIPYMDTPAGKQRRRRHRNFAVAGSIVVLVVALGLVHIFWSPLDVVWFRLLRKVDGVVPVLGTAGDVLQALARNAWNA